MDSYLSYWYYIFIVQVFLLVVRHNKGFGGEYGYDEKSKTNLNFMRIFRVWGGIVERIVMWGGGNFYKILLMLDGRLIPLWIYNIWDFVSNKNFYLLGFWIGWVFKNIGFLSLWRTFSCGDFEFGECLKIWGFCF